MKKAIYLCNNTKECKESSGCIVNGGECYSTTEEQFATYLTPIDFFEDAFENE